MEKEKAGIGFNSWKGKKDLGDAKKLGDYLGELWEKSGRFVFRGDVLRARKALNFASLTASDPAKANAEPEALAERLYTAANEAVYNQFAFNKRVCADMVELQDPDGEDPRPVIKKVFELKVDEKSGDFYHACYEVVYYGFLLRRAEQKGKEKTCPVCRRFTARYRLPDDLALYVLAPASFEKPESVKFLKSLNQALRKHTKANVFFCAIFPEFLAQVVKKDKAKIKALAYMRPYEQCKKLALNPTQKSTKKPH